ncbi:hypothetical protein EVAR_36114_1 [Eumeta japonica]|uniref:Uncharacterized protein n=1 Tax=Eumeta variegata TaxID=151549 RepID=A0A4C1X395_EUMVA|nr:hypothetical protein EVAR_36114_1 [Eumeta japonica]
MYSSNGTQRTFMSIAYENLYPYSCITSQRPSISLQTGRAASFDTRSGAGAPRPPTRGTRRPRAPTLVTKPSIGPLDVPTTRLGVTRIELIVPRSSNTARECFGCARPLSLFYSDAPADEEEKRSLVPRSRSHARLRRNATMNHAFSCVQPAFIDL